MTEKGHRMAQITAVLIALGIIAAAAAFAGGPAFAQFSSEGFADEDAAARAARKALGVAARPSVPMPDRKPAGKPAVAATGDGGQPIPGPADAAPRAVKTETPAENSATDQPREADEKPRRSATLGHEAAPGPAETDVPPADEDPAPAETEDMTTAPQERLSAVGAAGRANPGNAPEPASPAAVKSVALPGRKPPKPRPQALDKKERNAVPKRGKRKTREQQCAALTICRDAFAKCRFSKDRSQTDDEGWEIHKKKCGAEYQTCIERYFEPGEMFFTRWFLPYNPCS